MNTIHRTLFLALCAVAALLATGCTKELDQQMLGTWSVTSITEDISGNPDASSNSTVTTTYGDKEKLKLTYTFADDRSGVAVRTVVATGQAVESTFNYTVDNKEKTCTISWLSGSDRGQTHVWNVTVPEKKKMSFKRSSSVEGTYGDERGNLKPYTVTYSTSIVFASK